jgi:hypothetical protein
MVETIFLIASVGETGVMEVMGLVGAQDAKNVPAAAVPAKRRKSRRDIFCETDITFPPQKNLIFL